VARSRDEEEPSIDSIVRGAAATSFLGYPSAFLGTERYELVRKLGEGGFGVVYEVIDRVQGGRVALKLLRHPQAERLYRFKREFRALSENLHPNLVRLHELTALGRDLFFTMELVDGLPLLDHVARSPERARAAFKQLGDGLSALHASKLLHRDIKPSNVMVDRAGRVVLLDFGLALELDDHESSESAGTPLYMSPEQHAQEKLDEASDWYSFGLLLFEALTGRLPFDDLRQRPDAPPPSRFASGVPDDLDQLCAALLRRDPAARPSSDEVRRRLDATPLVLRDARVPFVGRADELAALHAAANASGCRVVLARGPSGIGKTALQRRFLDELKHARPETVVLAGRCYERESVPYKALDSICDGLARYLKQLPKSEAEALFPPDAAALARLFPVLRQVPLFQQHGPMRTDGRTDSVEAAELRARGAAALRELLTRLAQRRPVIVCIDDLQWGDVDSAALLADLVRAPAAPSLLWLASFREEEATTSPLLKKLTQLRQSLLRDVDVRELALGPLAVADARALAAALLPLPEREPARAENIASESGGNPFFVQELARRSDRGELALSELVSRRTAALERSERRLLEIAAAAARPIALDCLATAAAAGDELRDALARLRAERLVRGRESDTDQLIECYHDRIREAVAAAIEPERRREIHLALASALERHGADAAEIGQHLAEGGDAARAFGYVVRAAEAAATALAFDEAVRLYRRARELRPAASRAEGDVALQLAYADALSAAGHGVEAARVWLALLDAVDAHRRLDLQRRAAEELLSSGHFDEGWAVMASVLALLGLSAPRSTGGAVARVLLGRAQRALWGRRFRATLGPIDQTTRDRLDVVLSLSWMLWMTNPFLAAGIQAQYLPLALKSGDRAHASTALFIEALVSAGGGIASRERTRRLIDEARAVAAGFDLFPMVDTLLAAVQGTAALMEGHWLDALGEFDRAERLAAANSTWPGHGSARMIFSTMRLNVLFWIGRAGDVLRQIPTALQRAEERGHLTGSIWLLMMQGWALSCCGHVDEGLAAAAKMQARLPPRGFELPRWYQDHLQIQYALHRNDADGAWQALLVARRRTRFALTSQPQRIFGWWLAATAGLARAARSRDPSLRRSMLGEARRYCTRIERQHAPWADGLARALRAAVASIERDRDAAQRLLAEAEPLLASHHLELAAAAARTARGSLIGGDAGRELCARAASWAEVQGISQKALWSHLPGAWEA
jgi:hypothetical protein